MLAKGAAAYKNVTFDSDQHFVVNACLQAGYNLDYQRATLGQVTSAEYFQSVLTPEP